MKFSHVYRYFFFRKDLGFKGLEKKQPMDLLLVRALAYKEILRRRRIQRVYKGFLNILRKR